MSAKTIFRCLGTTLLAALLAGCDVGVGTLAPGGSSSRLRSGLYEYNAWSDYGGQGAAWWGYLDLDVDYDGTIYGSYRLPDQCSDDWGYAVDCVGRVGGRVNRDGVVRFGLDEGWLANEGVVRKGSRVTGSWETRVLGYRDAGGFELRPY